MPILTMSPIVRESLLTGYRIGFIVKALVIVEGCFQTAGLCGGGGGVSQGLKLGPIAGPNCCLPF